MDLTFDEEQEMCRRAFREFMEKECPVEVVSEMETDPRGFSREIWGKMARLGWLDLGMNDESGESGDAMTTTCILAEEMGRVLAPVPYVSTAVMGARAVAVGAEEPVRSRVLDSVGEGGCVIAAASTEGSRFDGLRTMRCEVRKSGGGYLLNGEKTFVEWAHVADYILLTARVNGGTTAMLVDRAEQGVTVRPLKTMGAERFARVSFEGVRVDPALTLGNGGRGGVSAAFEDAVVRGRVALAARMLGGCDAVLEAAAKYARERVQFSKPIGSFQAIAFRLADLATDLAGARLLVYKAAWTLDRGRPGASRLAAMAKAMTSDLYLKATDAGVHIYGGYGCMLEYDVHHYYRRAKAEAMALGDAERCRAEMFGAHAEERAVRWALPRQVEGAAL
ncbi:MAG: acyl-CoA dehydrogenase [Actinobacteria bacterium]|nr:acyl-CoA dehydrogenase [Actinomycetota bacterium]MBU1943743.1 acyl-CoA dehydrogenase [Actinomycetota bacterium]MBU2688767.1 acyl-CoA dehydrogenase [Actinomycetota bacterium]